MPFSIKFIRLFLALGVACTACTHRIHVTPLPASPSSITIPRDLQVILGPLSMEGADHRAGITLLDWSQRDLSQGILNYLQQRGTFASVSFEPADLTLRVDTKLSLTSRQNLYYYRIALQADMKGPSHLIKAYLVEQTAVGSSVRWVTASDREPIEAALRAALEELMGKIEADHRLYTSRVERSGP